MGRWVFERLAGAAVRRKPNESILFRSDQSNDDEYAGNDALVREVLQNALDARVSGEPVRVRFAIHELDEAPSLERLNYYFSRLKPAIDPEEPLAASFESCRFLVCEDFGTRGLEGDPERFSDPNPQMNQRQDFYWFWRNIGRSGKTGDDLGRWGLGKTVYRAASKIGCMLGLTIRHSDSTRLFMGQSVLQIHGHEGFEYLPEGYWCSEQNDLGLPLPISDSSEIREFSEDWKLTRRDEPGLSIVAPFVPDQLRAERLRQAVLVNFFTRIMRGELVVQIGETGRETIHIDASTINKLCKSEKWDGKKKTKRHSAPPIEFVADCLASENRFDTLLLGEHRLPEMKESSFEPSILSAARAKLSAGELTSVRVTISLPRKSGENCEGALDVHLKKTEDGEKCDSYFVREGMTIPKLNSKAGARGIQALVIVDPGPLATLLGDAEGPAHEDWETSQERPNQAWKNWKGRVKFARGIIDDILDVLIPPNKLKDFDLLSSYFSIDDSESPQRKKLRGKDRNGSPKFPQIVSEPKWYVITQSQAGGFSIRRNAQVELPKDAELTVSVAYDIPSANPLRNWSPIDFSIGIGAEALRPEGKDATFRSISGNTFLLSKLKDNFYINISGFDVSRDLFVSVDESTRKDETVS